ncbi:MAG: hypothetical protein LBG28_06380 [Tannerella sp.]|jgi:hypothetical protein|nr:hypothetical protein [Tannerella sp.]
MRYEPIPTRRVIDFRSQEAPTSGYGRKALRLQENGSPVAGERLSGCGRKALRSREKGSPVTGERLSGHGRKAIRLREVSTSGCRRYPLPVAGSANFRLAEESVKGEHALSSVERGWGTGKRKTAEPEKP